MLQLLIADRTATNPSEWPHIKIQRFTVTADVEIVKYFIDADVQMLTIRQGNTPLHVACVYFNLESIRILLEAGADFNLQDSDVKKLLERLPIEYRGIIDKIVV